MSGGFLSETVRLLLHYGEPTQAPTSLVAKCPAENTQARGVAAFLGMYEREVQFYRELAPRLDLRVPRCYLHRLEVDGDFTLLLEDVAGATMHDQDAGCGLDDARLALDAAATLHGAFWNDPQLAALPWLNRFGEAEAGMWQEMYRHAWPAFLGRDGVRLDPTLTALGDRLAASDIPEWISRHGGPLSLAHTDFHLSNLLYRGGSRGGDVREAVVLDWQLVAEAPPLVDVAFFLGRLPTEARRTSEEDLVRFYHRRLAAGGVYGYGWQQCWTDYQRWTWFGVLSAVVASVAYPLGEADLPRYTRKVARFLRAVHDHDAVRFLSRRRGESR